MYVEIMNWSFAGRCLVIMASVSIAPACSDSASSLVTDRAVRLSLRVGNIPGLTMELGPGASAQVNAEVFDAAGDQLELGGPLTVVSRDTAVARIDSGNRIHAVNPGSTTLFGSLNMDGETLTDSITFNVIAAPPSSLVLGTR